jgi:ATP-dependent DNA helicase RecG
VTTQEEFVALLAAPEGARLEFKAATGSFHFEELVRYVVALANEGGGSIVLGVEDNRPRRVVGTTAFPEPGRTEAGLYEQLHQRIQVEEHRHDGKRVLIVHAPSRLSGTAWQYKGSFWMRTGDALVAMSDEQLRRIHEETGPDFSAEPCAKAKLDDLDPEALAVLRRLWHRKSPELGVADRPLERLLADAELLVEGQVTYSALILLGTREALGRLLSQSEIVFEYRSSDAPGPAAERREFRQGFLPVLDPLWERINLRNDLQHFQHRLFVWDVPTFDERAVREAVLNAASHRDYRSSASVFVRQYPRRIEIVSPGGFPSGITPENVLWQQKPRNRRIADVLARCGLVERAGQGFDLIYRECIRHGKAVPDFSRTDAHWVWVTLHGDIADPEFLRFLEEIGQERLVSFGTDDFLIVDLVRRDQPIPDALRPRVEPLLEEGILDRVGHGRGTRLFLSHRFYRHLGKAGVYTRKRGLDRETNKALLVRHLRASGAVGSPMSELQQVLPAIPRSQMRRLLDELRTDGLVRLVGTRRGARWQIAGEAKANEPKMRHIREP